MPTQTSTVIASHIETPGDLAVNVASFRRHIAAANLTEQTQRTYLQSLARLAEYLTAQGMPTDVANIRREHLEAFIADLLARWTPATASNRFSGIQAFFKWCVEEGEIRANPMEHMRKPKQPEYRVPILADAEIRRLLDKTNGPEFADRRDTAIIRTFMGTGARLSEIANLALDDLDLDSGTIVVMGKGQRERIVYIGRQAIKAVDRYIRVRRQHPHVADPALWIGPKGKLTPSGIVQMLHDRGLVAGIPNLHAHLFRHRYAHAALSAGMNEGDVMAQAGWRTREMLSRYAKAAEADRSLAAARRLNPGDMV